MIRIRNLFLGALCATVATGCAMTNTEPYAINTNTQNTQPREFVLKKVSGQGLEAAKPSDLKGAVKDFIKDNSAFHQCGSACSGARGGMPTSWGADVSEQGEAFQLTYFYKEKYSTGRVDTAKIELLFPYSIKETAEAIQLTLKPADVAQAIPAKNAMGLATHVPIPDQHVADWAHHTLTVEESTGIAWVLNQNS